MNRLLCVLLLAGFSLLVGCPNTNKNDRPFSIGFMPKLTGIPYFHACQQGAEEAAKELGIKLHYGGPTAADSNQQVAMLDQWAASGEYDCLCVACNDPDLVARSLREAGTQGVLVVTFDADSQSDARRFFVNMATYDAVAHGMVDEMAQQLEPKGTGKVGLLTSSIQAPNQSEWAKRIKAYAHDRYPQMEILKEEEHGEDRAAGVAKAKSMIQSNKELKGIIGLTSVAVPAAAEAVRQEGKKGQIKVTGVSTPKDMRDYVKDGTVTAFILWNPIDLGYLTVHVGHLLHQGQMPENGTIDAGRLKNIKVKDREVLLGEPMRFDKDNIDKYDF
jgi:rhamnose transport system substrate-binding protein